MQLAAIPIRSPSPSLNRLRRPFLSYQGAYEIRRAGRRGARIPASYTNRLRASHRQRP
jgi:hypothetical protein